MQTDQVYLRHILQKTREMEGFMFSGVHAERVALDPPLAVRCLPCLLYLILASAG